MKKHLLVYDLEWWVLGHRARIIQKYHPNLQIISMKEMNQLIKKEGASKINRSYGVISAMGLEIASKLVDKNLRVDSSQVGGYNFFSKNNGTFREWCDQLDVDKAFVKKVISRIGRLAAFNPKLIEVLKELVPGKDVRYIRPFVDTTIFKPLKKKSLERSSTFTIGWVGNHRRRVKNYKTLYLPVVEAYKKKPDIMFVESTRGQRSVEEMPKFYSKLDLLLITSANEGAPNPALEAFSCGVPVLSTNVGFVKLVAHKEARSLILDTDKPRHFIKQIDYLVNNRDAYEELQKGCRANIYKNWTVEKAMGHWLTILFDIKK